MGGWLADPDMADVSPVRDADTKRLADMHPFLHPLPDAADVNRITPE